MVQDSIQDPVVRDTVAAAGHHFKHWWVFVAVVVVIAVAAFFSWRASRPIVVEHDNKRK